MQPLSKQKVPNEASTSENYAATTGHHSPNEDYVMSISSPVSSFMQLFALHYSMHGSTLRTSTPIKLVL